MESSRPYHILTPVIALVLSISTPGQTSAEPRIELIRGYEGQERYAEAATGQSEETRAALYAELVAEPYRECGQKLNGETDDLPDSRLSKPIVDLELLSATIDAIRSNEVDARIVETATRAASLLSAEYVTICVFAYHPEGPELSFVKGAAGGVMGFAFYGEGMMWVEPLLLDDVEIENWLADVDFTTAHELHHAVGHRRTRQHYEEHTLLDFIVGEGRADSFVNILYPGEIPPWSLALSASEESTAWAQMADSLDSTDETVIGEFLFGSAEKGIPRWSGYTIGFRIVQSYLNNHPDASIDAWTYIDARELLRDSGYSPGHTDSE